MRNKISVKQEKVCSQDSRLPGHVLDKNISPSSVNRKYVHTVACTVVFVGPARFVCNAYLGRNATCPLSSCSNKNDGHAVALTDFYRFCKGSVCVEVLTSFYGRFFVEEGQFINFTSSLHLCAFAAIFLIC